MDPDWNKIPVTPEEERAMRRKLGPLLDEPSVLTGSESVGTIPLGWLRRIIAWIKL